MKFRYAIELLAARLTEVITLIDRIEHDQRRLKQLRDERVDIDMALENLDEEDELP